MDRPNSIIEIIIKRSSRRNYRTEQLNRNILKQISNLLTSPPAGPFGGKSTFQLLHKSIAIDQKIKLGTYGFISGAQYFIVGKTVSSPEAFVDFGYRLEWIILQLTALGLGSCWLGGSFKRSEFAKLLDLKESEIIPAVTPVGYATDKRSVRDKLIRLGAGSKNRKFWSELFFDNNFEHPLTSNDIGEFATVLEMVRLAPSASNKQPWRIVKIGSIYHFFLQRTPGYGKIFPEIDLQKVDLGIAMCHFEMTAKEMDLRGHWKYLDPNISLPENSEYIHSWV
ncbi:nitroreductase family protein [bacterium]|nr:nitroreductase family protein [bacterium]MBU1063357.1 nitroreductase family protein [bacterium]MBU1635018.1 nitroreductase family protein [bacterium]MBU1874007.1 nitroreductase family protein [bacterium]